MGQNILYGIISLAICGAFFFGVDYFLMDMQGLDFLYMFRK